MHTRRLLIALAFQFAFCSIAFSQSRRVSNVYLTEKFSYFTNSDASLNHQNYFIYMSDEMGIASPSDMVLEKEIPGMNGFVHYKYKQAHEGIPIFGNSYILHEKDGKVVVANGRHTPNIATDLKPDLSPEEALIMAKYDMKAQLYHSIDPAPKLCLIDPAFPKISESVRLAYQIDLESQQPYDKRRYFVDAHTGKWFGIFR